MQSLNGEFESNSGMQNLHHASFASASDWNRKTVPSPPLPLPLSPVPWQLPPANGRRMTWMPSRSQAATSSVLSTSSSNAGEKSDPKYTAAKTTASAQYDAARSRWGTRARSSEIVGVEIALNWRGPIQVLQSTTRASKLLRTRPIVSARSPASLRRAVRRISIYPFLPALPHQRIQPSFRPKSDPPKSPSSLDPDCVDCSSSCHTTRSPAAVFPP